MGKEKIKKKETFTRAEVIKLLQKQISECSEAINADNLSEYTSRKKILETKIVEV